MRFSASASLFCAVGAVALGCTVYDSDLRTSGGGSSGGSGGAAGGASASGGTLGGSTPESAGKSGSGGDAAIAGTSSVGEGGAGGGEGGSGGDELGGSGGSSGAGGSSGTSGSGGTASGGSGGTGGSGPPPVLCSEHPLTPKTMWTATASISSPGNGTESDPLYNPPSHVLDGSNVERWSTGRDQRGDEWLQIDFKAIVNIKRIDLRLLSDTGGNGLDYPRAYAIRMTNIDGDATSPILASGPGTANTNLAVTFPAPVTGQFLMIKQTGVAENGTSWWTVAELSVSCTD